MLGGLSRVYLPAREGVSACQGGVFLPGGGCLPDTPAPPVWTEFLTHACENITFPQLRLRTVTRKISLKLFRLTSTEVVVIDRDTVCNVFVQESCGGRRTRTRSDCPRC